MKRDQQLSCPKKGNQSAYVVGVAQSLPWGVPQKLSTQLCPLWFDVPTSQMHALGSGWDVTRETQDLRCTVCELQRALY